MSSKDALAHKLFHASEVVAALPGCHLAPDPGSLLVGRAEVDAAPDAGIDDLLQEIGEPPEAARLPGETRAETANAILSLPKKSCRA